MLTAADIAFFKEQGYLVARGLVPQADLDALRDQLDRWIEESRSHDTNYGDTLDGKARFDLEAGHSAGQPKLRRVANPADISEVYRKVLWDGKVADAVAELIGPDIKFHHCKLNIKLPGMATRVDWHQDHPYDPHTNDDMLTTLVMLDDATERNGCIRVVPGSHNERYSLFFDGEFVGKVADDQAEEFERRSVPAEGRAGDVCFMHTWMMHGSAPNLADRPRRLLICDYTAADAFWITPPMVPSLHSGRVIRGKPSPVARLKAGVLEIPPHYEADSFFTVQGQQSAGEG